MRNKTQNSNLKSQKLHNVLLEIVEKKKQDLVSSHSEFISESHEILNQVQDDSKFKHAITAKKDIALISEIKFASPTNPHLGTKEELLDRAEIYEEAGADAISIITEPYFFKGEVSFVPKVKKTVGIPILQKDFVIDERQIYQAKEIGSNALLLIARLVDEKTLQKFVNLCFELSIEPVVEINNEEDLEKAINTKTKIIAVNARDLETFAVDVSRACKLLQQIPDTFIKLGFSGIHSKEEVAQYKNAGARGVLVGTSLMMAKNIKSFLSSLRANRESAAISNKIASSPAKPDPRNDSTVKVKICGIRTLENAKAAIAAGADFLGFNFVPTSKRKISVETAKKIIDAIRGSVKIVGIFQNQPVEEVNEIAEVLGLDFVQLHGEEDEEYIKNIKRKIIKRLVVLSETKDLRIKKDSSVLPQNDKIEFLILDRRVQGEGEMVDLEKAKEIAKEYPTFFSGGLTPDNVAEVVKNVKPFAVDVASGIETDGEIDNKKVKEFIQNAKGVTL